MEFSLFDTADEHETLTQWWEAQRWPAIDIDHLPPKGFGVTLNGKLAAAGFLYINGSALSNFEWIVADPKVRRQERADVLSLLLEGTKEFARQAGVRSIFTSTRHQSLIARMTKAGFQETDKNMTNLIARI